MTKNLTTKDAKSHGITQNATRTACVVDSLTAGGRHEQVFFSRRDLRNRDLKTIGTWETFPDGSLNFRPAPKSRTVLEQFEHQLKSEGAWMRDMLGIDVGEVLPGKRTKRAFIEKYRADATKRLGILRQKPDSWWEEETEFFDAPRSRVWVMVRRMNHSEHHRGQLVVYLRLLDQRVPSVYGPTADTDGKVIYSFDK